MNRQTIAARGRTATRPGHGALDTMARTGVLRTLAGIRDGTVTLHDAGGVHSFGHAGELDAHVFVLNPGFYRRVALESTLGGAASFIGGEWRADDLTSLLRIMVRNREVLNRMDRGPARLLTLPAKAFHWLRRNTRTGSRRNILDHYDLGNEFFSLFLDETMTYSSAIFEDPGMTLEEAQTAKMDRACRKLDLRPEDRLLEIGTGWGSLALHAATHYGCRVTTTTLSDEQYAFAAARVAAKGLGDRVSVIRKDYRDLDGSFDKIVSIEMIEAVGHEHLGAYFGACNRLLRPDGMFLLQAITMADHHYERYRRSVDFIQRYVFPGSLLPSMTSIMNAVSRRSDMRVLHVEDITPHYALTLRRWRERFLSRAEEVRKQGFSEEFIRMWEYYLSYCEAGFAERFIGTVQILLAKPHCRREPILAERGRMAPKER